MRDLKYLLAYLLPLSAIAALYWRGPWSWATFLLAFGILPLLDLWTPSSTVNVPASAEDGRSRRLFFDLLLYLNAPLLYAIVGYYFWTIGHASLSAVEWLGLTVSTGVIAGANGINVAHELGHRSHKGEQWLAQCMLLPALYQHFFIEHNRGHHKHVATLKDPATARLGEPLYAFWVRSVTGAWRSAWALERERLAKAGQLFWSQYNLMLRFQCIQLAYLGLVAYWLGVWGLISAVFVAIVGFLLLESVNYIEHYGLLRKQLPSGRPEPVLPKHSWNSNHEMGRIFLYELTRHSDHHYKASRKYQILRHMDESPQLPYGYPTSILIAVLPPLWFRVMDRRVVEKGVERLSG